MTTALAVPALKTLLPPPVTRCNDDDAHETLTYKSESGKWYENMGGSVAKKEDFNLWDVAIVNWAPKDLEQELGACEIQLALAKVPAEPSMNGLGVSVDDGNAYLMAYHTYKCPHLCCKPVFSAEGTSTISGNDYENMFLCPCHLSLFDPVSVITNVDEKGRKIFKSKETIKILNEMGREIEIGKLNDSMISKGAPLNACYCILEGRVRYYDALTNEYLLGEGSLIGAAEVLAPNKIHFDYRTEGYVKVAIIDFSIIKSAIDKLRPLTRGIIKYTHDRVMGQKERSSHHLVDDQFINQLDRYNHFNIKEGEILFDVGDKSDTFFYISEGSMNVVDENGKVLANLTSGQSFGEIAALTGMPRAARLVAKTETDLFEVRSSDVARELSFEPPVIKLIVRGIINQLIINN